MDSLTPNQIENIHNRILPHFNSRDGNFYQNVDNVLELAPEVDRTDLQCIMNPNFRSIHRKYHNDPKYVEILKKFGQCVYNNFLNGQPEDPITFKIINPGNVVVIEGYGYDKTTAGRLISWNTRNPMTNQKIDDNQVYRIERESAVNGEDMLNIMNGVEDDDF